MITRRQVLAGFAGLLGAAALSRAGGAVAGEDVAAAGTPELLQTGFVMFDIPTPMVSYQVFRGRIPIFTRDEGTRLEIVGYDHQPTLAEHQDVCAWLRQRHGPDTSIRMVLHAPHEFVWHGTLPMKSGDIITVESAARLRDLADERRDRFFARAKGEANIYY